MHFFGKLVFFLSLASAIPTTDSHHGILQARETCYLHSDAVKFQPLGCDSDPYNGQRKRAVGGGDNPVITCWATGREVSWTFETLGTVKHTRWAYWSSQSCWIWAPFFPNGFTSGIFFFFFPSSSFTHNNNAMEGNVVAWEFPTDFVYSITQAMYRDARLS